MPVVTAQGMGGGGALYCPRISPHSSDLMFVACDMTGLYRSIDGGLSWTLQNEREVQGSIRFSVAFHHATPGYVLAFHPTLGLHESTDDGATWKAWGYDADHPQLPTYYPQESFDPDPLRLVVTAAGFTRDASPQLLIGTTRGIYRIDTSVAKAWKRVFYNPATSSNDVSPTDIIGFVFPKGRTEYFVATVDDILISTDQGLTWVSIGNETTNQLTERPHGAFLTQEGPIPSRIRGFAGGAKPAAGGTGAYSVLYATILTAPGDINGGKGGVFRCDLPAAGFAASSVKWTRKMGSGATGLNTMIVGTVAPRYEHLGVTDDDPDTVYVTAINTIDTAHVYKGTFSSPQTGAIESWKGVYDGYQNHQGQPTLNVTKPGWIDEHEYNQIPPRLGWGFGGAARGFAVDPRSSQNAILSNTAFVHATTDGATSWVQRYSRQVSGTLATNTDTWQTTGLEVTTTWHYYILPTNKQIHLLCCTDIGLARSEDGGNSWFSIFTASSGGVTTKWTDWYEIAFDGTTNRMWAAVSDHHDYPYERELKRMATDIGIGVVLFGTNNGATWEVYTATGLPFRPVVSLIYRQGMLYASVWGSGVYRSMPDAANPNTGSAWQRVGAAFPGDSHNYRIDFDGSGNLYCIVAASLVNNVFTAGGLYFLPASAVSNSTTAWEKRSGGLEELLKKQLPTRGLAPMDFVFHPTSSNFLYLCTADIEKSQGGGGLYKFDLSTYTPTPPQGSTNGWAQLAVPFMTKNYHDTLQAFAPAFVGGILFVTSASHGTWWSANETTWTEYPVLNFLGTQRMLPTSDTTTGLAPLYITAFGGGAWEVMRQSYIIADHNTISKYEVDAVLAGLPAGQAGHIDNVFYLVFDGFLAAEVGITSIPPAGQAPMTFPQVVLTGKNGTAPDVTAAATGLVAEGGLSLPQRFTYTYELQFTSTKAFFEPDGVTKIENQPISLTVTQGAYGCKGQLRFIQPPNPYMLDGSIPWLSTDVRVFRITEGEQTHGAQTAIGSTTTGAIQWLKDLLDHYKASTGPGIPSPDFGNIATDYTNSWLELAQRPKDPVSGIRKNVFNFAIAQVRYRSASDDATDVRVFFRLCTTALTGLDYHKATTYRTGTNPSGDPIPLLGLSNGEVSTIPCFAETRVDTNRTIGNKRMTDQTDSKNKQTITHNGGSEVYRYYGAFLDINQTDAWFPRMPGTAGDGAYDPATMLTVQQIMNGRHQCLIAELNYAQDPISEGDTPSSSDNLSQRNLMLSNSDNPGNTASHIVQHTFEIRATERLGVKPSSRTRGNERDNGLIQGAAANDELLIWWGDLPKTTRATLYLNGIDMEEILALDRRQQSLSGIERVDAQTLRCRVDSLTYVPLPPTPYNIAGIITLELPDSVRYGQHFHVIVQQCSAPDRVIVGTFEFAIPVMEASQILPDEENTLAVMRYIERSVPAGSRWVPVLQRYVAQIAAHVDGLGGDAASIPPSPYGAPGGRNRRGCFERIRQLFFRLWQRRVALLLVLAICAVVFLLRKWLQGTDENV